MPPNFKFPQNEELWVPLYNEFPLKPRGDPTANGAQIMGRLKPGVTQDQANAEFIGLAKRIAKDNPKTNAQYTSASVQPLLKTFTGPQLTQIMYAMFGAVIVVLLIACVNVMNMQFGRAALRARELAIRGALGATRWRIVRQMLTESFLIAFLGAVVGVALAYWAVDLLARDHEHAAIPASLLDQVHDRRQGPRLHPRRGPLRDARFRARARLARRPRERLRDDEGRRARQQQPARQCHHPRPRRRPDRDDGRAPRRLRPADQLHPEPG